MNCELILLLFGKYHVTACPYPINYGKYSKKKKKNRIESVTVLTENYNHDKEIKRRYLWR